MFLSALLLYIFKDKLNKIPTSRLPGELGKIFKPKKKTWNSYLQECLEILQENWFLYTIIFIVVTTCGVLIVKGIQSLSSPSASQSQSVTEILSSVVKGFQDQAGNLYGTVKDSFNKQLDWFSKREVILQKEIREEKNISLTNFKDSHQTKADNKILSDKLDQTQKLCAQELHTKQQQLETLNTFRINSENEYQTCINNVEHTYINMLKAESPTSAAQTAINGLEITMNHKRDYKHADKLLLMEAMNFNPVPESLVNHANNQLILENTKKQILNKGAILYQPTESGGTPISLQTSAKPSKSPTDKTDFENWNEEAKLQAQTGGF